jgi:hypothetical protein
MDFLEEEVLAALPPRERPPLGQSVDFSSTSVEDYVAKYVEVQEPIANAEQVLAPLLQALLARRLPPPLAPAEVASVLTKDLPDSVVSNFFRVYPPFLPRVLKTLNGPAYNIVPLDMLAAAAGRERAISTLTTGWGHCDVPQYATAYRLLVSVGLPPDLLPPYKTLPTGMRGRVVAAWAAACKHFGWSACQPEGDVRAEKMKTTRINKMTLDL